MNGCQNASTNSMVETTNCMMELANSTIEMTNSIKQLTNSTVEAIYSPQVKAYQLVIVSIIVLFVITTNLILLKILIFKPEIRKNYRVEFILWLCLSDIVVGFSGFLFVFNYLIKDLSTNTHYCSLMYHFIAAGIGQSLAHTFLICIDRYMAVVSNVKYKMFNKKYRYIVIFGTWLFIHAYTGTLVIIWMRVDHMTYCSVHSFPNYKSFMFGLNVLFLPFLISIPCLYIYTVIAFKNRSKRTHLLPNPAISLIPSTHVHLPPSISRRQRYLNQLIKTTGLIIVALLCFSGPFIIVVLFLDGSDLIVLKTSFRMLFTFLTCCNSAVNPILYGLRIRQIREIVIRNLCPCKSARTVQ